MIAVKSLGGMSKQRATIEERRRRFPILVGVNPLPKGKRKLSIHASDIYAQGKCPLFQKLTFRNAWCCLNLGELQKIGPYTSRFDEQRRSWCRHWRCRDDCISTPGYSRWLGSQRCDVWQIRCKRSPRQYANQWADSIGRYHHLDINIPFFIHTRPVFSTPFSSSFPAPLANWRSSSSPMRSVALAP